MGRSLSDFRKLEGANGLGDKAVGDVRFTLGALFQPLSESIHGHDHPTAKPRVGNLM
jgi:hypothetical protein